MKILSGAYMKDSGVIRTEGKEVSISSPKRGRELGIGIVYQEFELVPDLSVAENIFLSRLSDRAGIINFKRIQRDTDKIMTDLGFHIDSNELVRNLPVASQQIVEIAKALSFNARILILDEPTAVLTYTEVEKLFETLENLKKKGVCIIYISHRIEEVFRIADNITTLRNGTVTGTTLRSGATVDSLVELMLGSRLNAMFPTRNSKIGNEVLRVDNLSNGYVFKNISFQLKRGEVLGIAGLVGSGRTEVLRAIFGGDGKKSGKVYLNGKQTEIESPKKGVSKGIALIPENRKDQGLIMEQSVRENMMLAGLKKAARFGVISGKKERETAQGLCAKLGVKTAGIEARADSLSGGNQQKIVLAKWFHLDNDIVLLDEPTRGVDVGAKAEIYKLINELAEDGKGVVMVSSEIPELVGMCDRILVMAKGSIVGELKKEEISEANILKMAIGGASL
jgi:ribose transport system ATP-binding protein